MPDKKETRGEKLRKLREAKGLSLEEVNQKTKIHIRVLKALESDTVEGMAPTYVKGLLKIYCGLLGANVNDFVESEDSAAVVSNPVPESKPAVVSVSPDENVESSLSAPRVNIVKRKKKTPDATPIIVITCLVLLFIVFSCRRKKQCPIENKTPSPALELTSPAPIVGNPKLGIRAKEDCWAEVKLDKKTIFSNILKRGQYEYWEAKKTIEFSLGNAGGVDIEVNGKLIPALGRRGQVIKNIQLTKEGLKVPQ